MIRQDLFIHTLGQLENGRTANDASELLHELLTACRETNRGAAPDMNK